MSDLTIVNVEKRYAGPMEQAGFTTRRLNKIRSLLPQQGNLLEIGALDGSTIRFYKEIFHGKTFGTDISWEILKDAVKVIDEVKPCDLNTEPLPWDDNFFDIVVCSEVIEHIFDTDHLLRQIKRVLKPSGTLIISTPNLSSFLNRIFILMGLQPMATEVSNEISNHGNPFRSAQAPAGHIRNFTARALKDILQHHGFAIEKTASVPLSEKKIILLVERLTGAISARWGSTIVMRCKKGT